MSKKKSLGSSPIGLKSNSNSMGFIPDLGVAEAKKEKITSSDSTFKKRQKEELPDETVQRNSDNNKKEKKVVSYNLEVELINKVKSIAEQKDMYYSTFVGTALKSWIARHQQS